MKNKYVEVYEMLNKIEKDNDKAMKRRLSILEAVQDMDFDTKIDIFSLIPQEDEEGNA